MYTILVNHPVPFELTENLALEVGLVLLPHILSMFASSVLQDPLSINDLNSSNSMIEKGKRIAKQHKSKNILSLKAAGRKTISNRGDYC